jgi:hypothetical protein
LPGHRRPPTAEEIDQRREERGTTASTPRFRDEGHEVQQLYDEIVRQIDSAVCP